MLYWSDFRNLMKTTIFYEQNSRELSSVQDLLQVLQCRLMYDFSMVQAAAASEATKLKYRMFYIMIKIQLNIWLGRPEYCNFWAPPACNLLFPLKGPVFKNNLTISRFKTWIYLVVWPRSAATAAKNLLSGEIIDIHTFWILIFNWQWVVYEHTSKFKLS